MMTAMIKACPTRSMRPNGYTAALKITNKVMAESRLIRAVHSRPKPIVNSATPAIGIKTSRGIPKVKKGFASTTG
jgi:hypothetical protein